MKLKRLSLQGYKTFATKTEFVFDDGITAIVGPNGSGKSNIADAIRWVLGEQSYVALRGRRTTDMIFAGSQGRTRAGMAQAVLTLDNSDGWLPLDFSEIEIARRAYRSGENEYLLNGQRVRLRDVTETLTNSGLAERTYTIIGQGLIDQALSLRAEERRALFEEAAGVFHYKQRRAEALRKLEETERNLERLQDIVGEIRPRLGRLKHQARRAENYRQVAADLRHLLRLWYGYQWERHKESLRATREKAERASAAWENARLKQSDNAEQLRIARQSAQHIRRQIAEKESALRKMRDTLEHARRQVAVAGERRSLLRRQQDELRDELPGLDKLLTDAEIALESSMEELSSAKGHLEEAQVQELAFQSEFKDRRDQIERLQKRIIELEQELSSQQRVLAQEEGKISQLRQRLMDKKTNSIGNEEIAQLESALKASQSAAASAQRRFDELQRDRAIVQQQRRDMLQELSGRRQIASQWERKIALLESERARLRERTALLDSFGPGIPADDQTTEAAERLAALLEIPEEFRPAVEAALANKLEAMVVSDVDALWRLIGASGDQSVVVGAAGALRPPNREPSPEVHGVIGWASDLVRAPQTLTALVELLLNRVLIVKSQDRAFEVALHGLPVGGRAVTPDGFLVHSGGLVETPGRRGDSPATRAQEWRRSKRELAELQQRLKKVTEEADERNNSVIQLQDSIDESASREEALLQALQEAQRALANAQREVDSSRERHGYVSARHAVDNAEAKELRATLEQLENSRSASSKRVERLQIELEAARVQLEEYPVTETDERQRNIDQQIEAAATITAGRQAVVDSRRATRDQLAEQLDRISTRRRELREQERKLELGGAQEELDRLEREFASASEALNPLVLQLDEIQATVEALESGTAEMLQTGYSLERDHTQARIELGQAESRLENLKERILSDLGIVELQYDEDQPGQAPLPIAEVVERLPDVSELPEDIEESIQRLRGQMTRTGSIDASAPQEYEETRERHEFLLEQIEDLETTKDRLRHVIDELDEETSKAFRATVEDVNREFGIIFERLFGGGSAQLSLTEPDNVISSGVEIIARLPNRREQGLALLSGGERSLTATALVFALLKVAPTPFCVLDEVDAMLDEANVRRFRELLYELSRQTQFIVITHNRGTVQAARTVYGVSIGSESISQVISIRPDEYLETAEPAVN